MTDDPAYEEAQQRQGLEAVFREAFMPYVGRRLTPELVAEIREKVETRVRILDQLLEHEELPEE